MRISRMMIRTIASSVPMPTYMWSSLRFVSDCSGVPRRGRA
jgi:hypothetical protein